MQLEQRKLKSREKSKDYVIPWLMYGVIDVHTGVAFMPEKANVGPSLKLSYDARSEAT